MANGERSWTCVFGYPGKKPLRYGNVWADVNASAYEVERQAQAEMLEHLPEGFQIVRLEPGIITFNPEKSNG